MMKKILELKLKFIAKLYLRRYKPMIIAVTGNAGKTSTKEAVGAVVSAVKKTRVGSGNWNNELGVPATIIGNWDKEYAVAGFSKTFWFKIVWKGFWRYVFGTDYPEAIVLEYGADHPGDIRRLVADYKPHISVVTTVGDVPVHVEYFKTPEAVAEEKSNLVRVLDAGDFAVLNHDDHRVLAMRTLTKAKVVTYGFEEGSEVKASHAQIISENNKPVGVSFNISDRSGSGDFVVKDSLGKSQAWSGAAAAAVGSVLGMSLPQISEALKNYHGPKGRLKIIEGIKNSTIIDDTYNASPASTRLALDTLKEISASRKMAILGDMLELGEYTEAAHLAIGQYASEAADILICVGSRMKFAAQAATLPVEQVLTFADSMEAKLKIQELIREGDLILVKGSQGSRMEKIIEEIMAHPENKKDLLVRQSSRWLSK